MYLYLPERIYKALKNDEEYNNFKFIFEKQFERFSGKGLIDSYYMDENGKKVIDTLGVAGKELIETLILEKIPEALNQFRFLFYDHDYVTYLADQKNLKEEIEKIPNFTLNDIWNTVVKLNEFDEETQISFCYHMLFNFRDYTLDFTLYENEYNLFLIDKIIELAEKHSSIKFSESIYAHIFYTKCMKLILDWRENLKKGDFEGEFQDLIDSIEEILDYSLEVYKLYGINYLYLKNMIIYEFHNIIWNLAVLLRQHLKAIPEEKDYIEVLYKIKEKHSLTHTFSFFEFMFVHESFLTYFYDRNFEKAFEKLNKISDYISYAFLNPKESFHELNYHQDNFVPSFASTCNFYVNLSRTITKMKTLPTDEKYLKSECDLMFLNGFLDKIMSLTNNEFKQQEAEDFISVNKETFNFFNLFLEQNEKGE